MFWKIKLCTDVQNTINICWWWWGLKSTQQCLQWSLVTKHHWFWVFYPTNCPQVGSDTDLGVPAILPQRNVVITRRQPVTCKSKTFSCIHCILVHACFVKLNLCLCLNIFPGLYFFDRGNILNSFIVFNMKCIHGFLALTCYGQIITPSRFMWFIYPNIIQVVALKPVLMN